MANANFTLKLDLDEANDLRDALHEKRDKIAAKPIRDMTIADKAQLGRIETLLRREFEGGSRS